MDDAAASAGRRDFFVDERGAALRVTWHPERATVVMSLWHGGVCTGSVRLSVADAGRLASLLVGVLAEQVRPPAASPASPAPSGRWREAVERVRRAIA